MTEADLRYMADMARERFDQIMDVLKDMPRPLLLMIRWVKGVSHGSKIFPLEQNIALACSKWLKGRIVACLKMWPGSLTNCRLLSVHEWKPLDGGGGDILTRTLFQVVSVDFRQEEIVAIGWQ